MPGPARVRVLTGGRAGSLVLVSVIKDIESLLEVYMFLWNYELVNPEAMRAALNSAALIAEGLHDVSKVVPDATRLFCLRVQLGHA